MTTEAEASTASAGQRALAGALLVGAATSLTIGVYARAHTPSHRQLFLVGFSGMLQMKTWLTTIALVFVLVQLSTALAMWGHIPGVDGTNPAIALAHRWSGAIAFAAMIPVALHCVWALGFSDITTRTLLHSVAGCALFGAYAAKMLSLRARGLPGWALPVLGGLLFASFIVVWLTSALWFFTSSGAPLT